MTIVSATARVFLSVVALALSILLSAATLDLLIGHTNHAGLTQLLAMTVFGPSLWVVWTTRRDAPQPPPGRWRRPLARLLSVIGKPLRVAAGLERRDWWAIAVVLAVLLHALLPRYEWRDPGGEDHSTYIRIDRWSGRAEIGLFFEASRGHYGRWLSMSEIRALPRVQR